MKISTLLFKKCQRSIKNSYKQFLAIIGIASIAITLFLGLSSNADSLEKRVNNYYETGNVSDIYVTVNKYDETDKENIQNILNDNGGGVLSNRTYMPSFLKDLSAIACISDFYPVNNTPLLLEGGVDENGNYFLIDESLTRKKEFKTQINIGDAVELSFASSYFSSFFSFDLSLLNAFLKPNGRNFLLDDLITVDLTVTGTMDFCENIQNGSYSATNFVLSKDYLVSKFIDLINENFVSTVANYASNYLSNLNISNQYLLRLNNKKKINNCLNDIQNYFNSNDRLYSLSNLDNQAFNLIIRSDIDQARQLTLVFPVFFFFVAILVILTTISELIIKERLEIGTLKAIGVKQSTIFKYYMALMLSLVGIGLIIGVVVGPLLIPGIMNIKYSILYTLPKMPYVFPIKEFLITFFALVGLTALCVYCVSKGEIKLTPSESMRPKKIKSLHSKTNTKSKLVSSSSISFKMAFRNIRLNPLKSLMVVIGVMGCTSLLVAGFGIDNTLDHCIKHDMDMFYSAEIMITYNTGAKGSKDKLLTYEEVEEVNELRIVSITAAGKKNVDTSLFVMEHEHNLTKFDLPVEGITISQKVANDGNYKVGDTISFQVNNKAYSGKVNQILNTFVRHGLFIDVSNPEYSDLLSIYSSAFVKLKEGYDTLEFKEKISKDISEIALVTTRSEMYKTVNSAISSISYMTLTVKVFAILLAVVVLYNLTYLNFKERIREIATLKVLGFRKINIAKSLIFETMLLVLIGTIFGLFLGFPVEFIVLYVNRNAIVEFLYTVYNLTYLISFVISFITAFIINLILSLYIKKIKMVESLKSVE